VDRLSCGAVGWVLVTNDDGVDSPALFPLLRALGRSERVRAVVPDRERSWISKAITRWEEVPVERVEREGFEIGLVRGFPADCTNLGVHSLFGDRPDLVVSGVNVGLNTGLAFFLSSGTVGAAAEGWIAGVPALAFSVGVQGDDRDWKSDLERVSADGAWDRAGALAAEVLAEVRRNGMPEACDLLNVNFPVGAGPETRRVVTRIAAVGYDRLFERKSDGLYVHDFDGRLRGEDLEGTDIAAVKAGWVSITPVRLAHTADLEDADRRRFERGS
jgi:5'-nucleotidase